MPTEPIHDTVSWVWFDLDDTLIDFHANSRAANRLVFAEMGLEEWYPSAEAWIADYEEHNRDLWRRYQGGEISQDFLRVDRFAHLLRPRWTRGEEELTALAWRLDEGYLDRLAREKRLVEGAAEVVTALRARKYNIGVLSNGFASVQHRKIASAGLADLIDLTVLSDDIGVTKPHPALYRHAMERAADMDPGHHLMVGDNPDTDIAGALASGWSAVLYAPAASPAAPPGGALRVSRLADLPGLLAPFGPRNGAKVVRK